jgi:hypothetical protein
MSEGPVCVAGGGGGVFLFFLFGCSFNVLVSGSVRCGMRFSFY